MEIHLEIAEKPRDISYFSLGDFTLEEDGLCFTTRPKGCKILTSLPDLFHRLVRLKKGEIRKFVFTPMSISYDLLFEKQKGQLVISEFSRQKMICGIDEFAELLYKAVMEMFIRYDLEISELGSGREDFLESWIEFKAEFSFSDPEKDLENGWA
jgi:hypothetical protein